MKHTTENSEMPNSETFKERFLATAKNKDDILEALQSIKKEDILEILKQKENTWFFSSQLLLSLFFVAPLLTFVKNINYPPKTIPCTLPAQC